RISPVLKLWLPEHDADTRSMRRLVSVGLAVLAFVVAGSASARPTPDPSWASDQIATVVGVGLMAPSVESFRPQDPLTESELATVVASLGGAISVSDPYA